jgi:hypothetical protein
VHAVKEKPIMPSFALNFQRPVLCRFSLKSVGIFALMLTFGVLRSEGAILISTLGQSTGGGGPFESTGRLYATDFLTGSLPSSITTLTIQAHNDAAAPHTLLAEVWSNVSGNPGSILDAFDTSITVSPFAGSSTYVASDAGIALSASTIYWLVLRTGENPGLGGRLVVDITSGQDVNAGGIYSGVFTTQFKIQPNAGDGFINNSDFTPIYQLEGNAAVPEPSTFSMLISSLGVLGLWFSRRSGRSVWRRVAVYSKACA